MRRRRLLPALTAVALAAGASLASAAAPTSVCGEGNFAVETWVTLTSPRFPAGDTQIVDFAVSAADPRRVYVTNGAAVMSSRDGGCTWSVATQQPELPLTGTSGRVMHLAMSAADPDVVYAAIGSDLASRPRIMRTGDGGRSWTPADAGLELVQGVPLQLVVAPSRADTAYLVVEGNRAEQGDLSAEVARSLYTTTDGRTWAERQATPLLVGGLGQQIGPIRVSGNGGFAGVTVDPRNADLVWLYGAFGLWRSTDGAATSRRIVPGTGDAPDSAPIGAVEVYHPVSGPARILAFGSLSEVAYGSFDDGRKFSKIPTPGIVRSAATGRRSAELAIATDSRVFYQGGAEAPSRQITPAGPPVRDLQVSTAGTPVFYARSTAALLRWTAPPDPKPSGGPSVIAPVEVPGSLAVPQLPPLPQATLQGPAEITVPALESRTVPYTLDLPGVRRVDVFFLVDVSDSMEAEIAGLRSALAGIVTELVASNIEAWFGVGRYNTYGTEPYLRVSPVMPPGPRLSAALESLVASGGGADKSQIEAVYQAATGVGKRGDSFIPAGQEAGFRANVPAKLILNITDEAFNEKEPSPSYDDVSAALRARGVRQLGLALDDDDVLPTIGPGPEVGLRRLAAGSGAVAPAEGVDCDGDGTNDIDAGEPLVCVMPSTRSDEATMLANAIVNLVRSLPSTGTTELAVTARSPEAPIPTTTRASFEVDFTRTLQRKVGVTFTCPGEESAVHSYQVEARAQGSLLAGVPTVVRCVAEPAAAAARLVPPAAAAALPNPPPPPPSTITHSNPNPNANPNPNPQPQGQGQVQAGMVGQEQDEPQLAYAGVHADDIESELAMTGLPRGRHDASSAVAVSLAAGVVLGSAGLALGRRQQRQIAVQQVHVG